VPARPKDGRAECERQKRRAANARTATAASFDPDGISWTRFVNNSGNAQSFSASKKERDFNT
jgi:hypothetical protein